MPISEVFCREKPKYPKKTHAMTENHPIRWRPVSYFGPIWWEVRAFATESARQLQYFTDCRPYTNNNFLRKWK